MSSPTDLARQIANTLRGKAVRIAEPVGRGTNNRVHYIAFEDDEMAALKSYLRHSADTRDRLGTEFDALRFFERHGVDVVPRPLAPRFDFPDSRGPVR